MREIPSEGDEPRIQIYDDLEELRKVTGQKVCHGYFDASQNLIVATADSVAHEIAHFRDFRSGRLKSISRIQNSEEKISARIRNEIVAILFAYSKCGEGATALKHEINFMNWFLYSRKRLDGIPHGDREISKLLFAEIQQIADVISSHQQPWFDRLKFIFRSYLHDEIPAMTYHR